MWDAVLTKKDVTVPKGMLQHTGSTTTRAELYRTSSWWLTFAASRCVALTVPKGMRKASRPTSERTT